MSDVQGSPAHAGIDPCRGQSLDELISYGSPAHAGIDPCGKTVHQVGLGFPRTRGDRPGPAPDSQVPPHTAASSVPPHTRG